MASFPVINDCPSEVASQISDGDLLSLLVHLLGACRKIGTVMRDGGYSSHEVGTSNVFGDNQLDVDVQTDAVIFDG